MKADERKELEQNSLAKSTTALVENVKTGNFLTPSIIRIGALVAALVLILGLWAYLSRESRKATSREWASLANSSTEELEEHSKNFKDSLSGRIARLETARRLVGPQGMAMMNSGDRDAQRKGFENIEKARAEFVALAAEFKSDKTLKATCLLEAAEAELALAGVPKDASGFEKRGDPVKAAAFYDELASLFDAKSATAEKYKAKAEECRKNAEAIAKVGRDLFDRANPVPTIDASPKAGLGPIAPTTIIPTTNPAPTPGVLPPTAPIQTPTPIPAPTPATAPTPPPAPTPVMPTTPTTAKK